MLWHNACTSDSIKVFCCCLEYNMRTFYLIVKHIWGRMVKSSCSRWSVIILDTSFRHTIVTTMMDVTVRMYVTLPTLANSLTGVVYITTLEGVTLRHRNLSHHPPFWLFCVIWWIVYQSTDFFVTDIFAFHMSGSKSTKFFLCVVTGI